MNTITMTAEINKEDVSFFQTLLQKFKAKKVVFEEKDPTKMSKEEYFEMIEQRRVGKKVKMSEEELRQLMFEE